MSRSRLTAAIPLIAACWAAAASAQVDAAREEQAIRARGDRMLIAENARDLDTSILYYAEDAIVQSPNQPTLIGRPAIRAMYARFQAVAPPMKGEFADRVITVAGSGDLAWEHGGSRTTITTPAGTTVEVGKQLIVWKKLAGEWVIAAISWSGNTPPQARPAPRN